MYFHRTKEEKEKRNFTSIPPSISFGGAFGTENGTWGGLLGHVGSFKEDQIRYRGFLVYVDANIDFYRTANNQQEYSFRTNMTGAGVYQNLSVRLGNSDFFVGGNYLFYTNHVRFPLSEVVPALPDLKGDTRVGGLSLQTLYDRRNNTFSPSQGNFVIVECGNFAPYFGGDDNFVALRIKNTNFTKKLIPKTTIGLRYNFEYKTENTPFYALPFVDLRGVPMMRYQGHMTNVIETEWSVNFYKRWSLNLFTGSGWNTDKFNEIEIDQAVVNYGTGIRYLIARKYGIQTGLDFAWSPEDFAWYIVFGSAWLR